MTHGPPMQAVRYGMLGMAPFGVVIHLMGVVSLKNDGGGYHLTRTQSQGRFASYRVWREGMVRAMNHKRIALESSPGNTVDEIVEEVCRSGGLD